MFDRTFIRMGRTIGSKLVPTTLTSTSCLLLWNVGGFTLKGGNFRWTPLGCLFAEPPFIHFWLWTDVWTLDILGFALALTAFLALVKGGRTESSLLSNWPSTRGFDLLKGVKLLEFETTVAASSWWDVSPWILKWIGDGIRWLA